MAQQKMQKVNKMPNPIGNLYTAGAVQFNTQPLVNLSMQLAARRQAKEDAFNQYLQTAASRLTPAGMRTEEMPEFIDKKNKWQQFVMENKDKLSKSPELQMQANSMFQDTLATSVRSKQYAENGKPLFNEMVKPDWREKADMGEVGSMTKSFHQPSYIQDQHGNWVPNKEFQNLDYTRPMFKEHTYDSNKEWPIITQGMKPQDLPGEIIPGSSSNGKVKRQYTNGYTNEQLQQLGRNAMASHNEDADRYYKAKVQNLSHDDLVKYTGILQSVYGKGKQIVQPDGLIIDENTANTPENLHAAMMIEKAKNSGVPLVKLEDDYNQRQQDKRTNIIINQSGKNNNTPTIDLSEYEDVPGKGKNITPLMGGVKVTAVGPKGDTFRAEKVYYDPATKRVTLKEYDKKDETTMTLQSFLQNIKTSNPGTDMKFLEGLANVSEPPSSSVIHINDIPAGVKLEQKGGKYYYKGKLVKTD